jgi:hypothetical protein
LKKDQRINPESRGVNFRHLGGQLPSTGGSILRQLTNVEESKLKSIYTSIWAKQYFSQNKLISLTVIDKDEVEFITEFSRQNKSYSEMSITKSTVRLKLHNGKINEIGVRK